MTNVVPYPNPLPQLATPGERLGWIFNDRNLYRRKFMEPPPQPGTVPPDLRDRLRPGAARDDQADPHLARCRHRTRRPDQLLRRRGSPAPRSDSGVGAAVGSSWPSSRSLAGVGGAVLAGVLPRSAKKAHREAQNEIQQRYERAYAAWDSRRQWHEQQQQQAVDAMFEWGAAARRPAPGGSTSSAAPRTAGRRFSPSSAVRCSPPAAA